MSKKRALYGIVAALVAVVSLGVFAGAASAQPYIPDDTVVVDDTQVPPGGQVTVSACCFAPGTEVDFWLNSDPVFLGTAIADSNGVASLTFAVPAGVPAGTHTVSATGIDATTGELVTISTEIAITTAADGGTEPAPGTLPRTGSDSTDLLRVGALLVAAGGAVVVITRKRSRDKVDA